MARRFAIGAITGGGNDTYARLVSPPGAVAMTMLRVLPR
jgi:hypothetical protein